MCFHADELLMLDDLLKLGQLSWTWTILWTNWR